MSKQDNSTASKPEAMSALVPKLRFPEFRGTDAWEPATLGEESTILKGKGISKADLNPNGSQACIRYGELYTRYGETIREAVSRTKIPASQLFLSKPDDVIIPSSGETKIDIAKASCVLAGGIALGGDLNVIRSKLYGPFLSYYLNGPKRLEIAKLAQGDTVVHLYPHQLKTLHIAVPSPTEQQKIAECLSSLDELIAAQARKVDAIKTHKTGLMQQLFPREDETQPRLRFPEFQNAGEWDKKKLGKHVEIQSGYSPSYYALSSSGEYPFVKVEDLNNCIKYQMSGREFCEDSDGVIPANSILFPKRGAAIELNKIRITATEILIDTNLMALTPKDGLKAEFLFYYLSNVGLSHIADTSTIPQINNKHITPFDLRLPKEAEQHRIASCLSSLDALITAETQKLEALKTHKKGMMQELFPHPEVVAR